MPNILKWTLPALLLAALIAPPSQAIFLSTNKALDDASGASSNSETAFDGTGDYSNSVQNPPLSDGRMQPPQESKSLRRGGPAPATLKEPANPIAKMSGKASKAEAGEPSTLKKAVYIGGGAVAGAGVALLLGAGLWGVVLGLVIGAVAGWIGLKLF